MEDGWNNFRKTICEVVDCVLRKIFKTTTRNISEKALCLIEIRRGLYKNYRSGKSYEKKECKESGERMKI